MNGGSSKKKWGSMNPIFYLLNYTCRYGIFIVILVFFLQKNHILTVNLINKREGIS
jgi:hypothetical protein